MTNLHERLKRVREISADNGIQSILDSAYRVLGNPIAMFDTEYRLHGHTKVITDDPIWNELITYGTFSNETQVLFMEEGFVDAVANAESLVVLTSEKLKYDRISAKLFDDDGIHVANISIVCCNKPLEDDDLIVARSICGLLSEALCKNETYKSYGRQYQETYIRKLIDGEIVDKALFAAHIAIVYHAFKSSMRLVVADVTGVNQDDSELTYYRDLFRESESKHEYAIYDNYIIIVIEVNEKGFEPQRDLGKVYGLFEKYNVRAGISTAFDNLYELRKYYQEAVEALQDGLRKDAETCIFVYEQEVEED